MIARDRFVVTLAIVPAIALLSTFNVTAAGGGVSPGALDRFAVSRDDCPTFSWAGDPQADSYDLVAFALPEGVEPDQVLDQHLTAESQVLSQRLPGGATAWTPAADQ
jgi:hypothetical protein